LAKYEIVPPAEQAKSTNKFSISALQNFMFGRTSPPNTGRYASRFSSALQLLFSLGIITGSKSKIAAAISKAIQIPLLMKITGLAPEIVIA
jgi:hypothetical protein